MFVDFKYTLMIIDEILAEHKKDKTVRDACKLATTEIIRQLNRREAEQDNVERSREFILYRARTILNLLRDTLIYAPKKSENADSEVQLYEVLIGLVNQKLQDINENQDTEDIKKGGR